MINLRASGLCRLTIFGPPQGPDALPPIHCRVLLPGNSTVRIGEVLVRIPLGEDRYVGPCLTGDYEIVDMS
jgi:hypothetical protein